MVDHGIDMWGRSQQSTTNFDSNHLRYEARIQREREDSNEDNVRPSDYNRETIQGKEKAGLNNS